MTGSNVTTLKTIDDRLNWSWLITDLTWDSDTGQNPVRMKILTMIATVYGDDFKDGNYYQANA